MNETRFITRPRLAVVLMEKGYNGIRIPNPYDPNRPAWSFEASPELDQVIAEYKKNLQKEGA